MFFQAAGLPPEPQTKPITAGRPAWRQEVDKVEERRKRKWIRSLVER